MCRRKNKMAETFILGFADYAIIGIVLVISAGIGICIRVVGGRQITNEDYLFAGKNMSILPVAMSLMASFMSAITLIGTPAEAYMFGSQIIYGNIGTVLGVIIASYVFLPIYFDTGVSTSFEYLKRRFGKSTQRILSGIFLFKTILYNGLVLYAPALALSAVTNLSIRTSMISIGVVCTFYCTIGGMKAVLWTDVLQASLMYICVFSIIGKGCIDHGGINNIFKIATDGGRINTATFQMNFSTRYTMYSVLLQGMILTVFGYGGSQIGIQRQLTLNNLKLSQISNFISTAMVITFHLLCCLCGIIIYVHFKECDPITSPSKSINSADQLLPYYVASVLSEYQGLPGLCIAGILSASLSSVSSTINSMAAVTYEDIIRPLWPNISSSIVITKFASVFYGSLCIVMSFVGASLGNIVIATILIIGMVSGPALGVFLLAALTTTATEKGANLGIIASYLFSGCATFIPNKRYYPILPLEKNCYSPPVNMSKHSMLEDFYNSSQYLSMNYSTSPISKSANYIFPIDNFPVSFMWISPISLVVCVVVGYCASIIFSYIDGKSNSVSPILLSPLRRYFLNGESSDKQMHVNDPEYTALSSL